MVSVILGGFWLCGTVASLGAVGTVYLDHLLPQFIKDIVQYGKTRRQSGRRSLVSLIEVPKAWFTHFYVVGVLINSYMTVVLARHYILNAALPDWLINTLYYVQSGQQVSTDSLSALLLVLLMLLQNIRRLYECLFISSYSNSTMNILHYMLGIALYSTFSLTVLAEAPRPTTSYTSQQNDYKGIESLLVDVSWRHMIGLLLFFYSSYHHHIVHRQFASFRCNKKGEVVTLQHVIPHGGWFELVSCPHYTMEILIYLSFMLIGGLGHMTLATVVLFVFCNQVVAGLLSHSWYLKKFKDYPKHRHAVIPYIL